MLRPLLEDRFKLRVRHERRERPIFELLLTNDNGTLGAQLTRSTCTPRENRSSAPVRTPPPQPAPWAQEAERTCNPLRIAAGPTITGEGATMSEIADTLAGLPVINRVVRDNTGLDGRFDFRLRWVPGGPSPDPDAGPDLFAALRDQLGLRLARATAPVDVIVVDDMEPLIED